MGMAMIEIEMEGADVMVMVLHRWIIASSSAEQTSIVTTWRDTSSPWYENIETCRLPYSHLPTGRG